MTTVSGKRVWVYDIEVLSNLFTYTGLSLDGEIKQFVLFEDSNINDIKALLDHLSDEVSGLIGFNNINYDYPVLHTIIESRGNISTYDIYSRSQEVINTEWSSIAEWNVIIPQLDLFKIHHFDNRARSCSLKQVAIAINHDRVQDMPISHTDHIKEHQIKDILDYNLNDVIITKKFYDLTKDKIELRKGLIKKYKIPCLNYSDSKIGEQLILDLYCKAVKKDKKDVRKWRTVRESINFGDCIFNYIKFESEQFNNFLEKLKQKVIRSTKGAFSRSVIYKGFRFDYGTGGLHGCIKPGIYESDDDHVIIDSDVASLYPSIAIQNQLYPEHLGKIFCSVYENEIVRPRLEAKKRGDKIMADGFKLSANSVYGKSNDKYSFLQDAEYTMKTTLNGQLMLTMLSEKLMNAIPELLFIQANTDGITVKIPKDKQDLHYKICKEWEEFTNLVLEHAYYDKMVIRDVNNYASRYTNGKIKYKGAFEIDKEYHKDTSHKIIPIALSKYFFEEVPVEKTIKEHRNIYDFCGCHRSKKGIYSETRTLGYDVNDNPIIVANKQQKTVRYYVSNSNTTFYKIYESGKSAGTEEVIEKGYHVTIFNDYINKKWEDYDIDYSYYIKECYKIINIIKPAQIHLF